MPDKTNFCNGQSEDQGRTCDDLFTTAPSLDQEAVWALKQIATSLEQLTELASKLWKEMME